jgi:hypothetical protein
MRLKSAATECASDFEASVFRHAGHAFEQNVPTDQKRQNELADHFVLPNDGLLNFGADIRGQLLNRQSSASANFGLHELFES